MHRGAPYRHSDQELTNHMAIPIVFHHEEDFTYVTFARLDEPQGLTGLGVFSSLPYLRLCQLGVTLRLKKRRPILCKVPKMKQVQRGQKNKKTPEKVKLNQILSTRLEPEG